MLREDPLDGLLDDLERQAEGLHLADRAAEVADLRIAQDAEVGLAGRWHASVDRLLRVVTADGWGVAGQLVRAGADWVVLEGGSGRGWALHLRFVATVVGLADGTVPAEARPLSARLSLGSVLRGLAETPEPVAVRVVGGLVVHGTVTRVGADFVELRLEGGEPTVVPFGALVAVQLGSGGG